MNKFQTAVPGYGPEGKEQKRKDDTRHVINRAVTRFALSSDKDFNTGI